MIFFLSYTSDMIYCGIHNKRLLHAFLIGLDLVSSNKYMVCDRHTVKHTHITLNGVWQACREVGYTLMISDLPVLPHKAKRHHTTRNVHRVM